MKTAIMLGLLVFTSSIVAGTWQPSTITNGNDNSTNDGIEVLFVFSTQNGKIQFFGSSVDGTNKQYSYAGVEQRHVLAILLTAANSGKKVRVCGDADGGFPYVFDRLILVNK